MYELSHVSKSFVIAGKRRVDALKDVTIRFPDHGLVFIVGKSGAGKSTLLNLLGFFLKPDQGGFTYQGEKAASFSASKIRELRRDSIAFCFQNDNLDPDLSVFDNILLAKAAAMKAVSLSNLWPFFSFLEGIRGIITTQIILRRNISC
jgi:putative ABC transport system permease protein